MIRVHLHVWIVKLAHTVALKVNPRVSLAELVPSPTVLLPHLVTTVLWERTCTVPVLFGWLLGCLLVVGWLDVQLLCWLCVDSVCAGVIPGS